MLLTSCLSREDVPCATQSCKSVHYRKQPRASDDRYAVIIARLHSFVWLLPPISLFHISTSSFLVFCFTTSTCAHQLGWRPVYRVTDENSSLLVTRSFPPSRRRSACPPTSISARLISIHRQDCADPQANRAAETMRDHSRGSGQRFVYKGERDINGGSECPIRR